MIALNSKAMKASFLKGIATKKYSIKDLKEDKISIVLDCEDNTGDVHDPETGERFTAQQVQEWKESKNHLIVEL